LHAARAVPDPALARNPEMEGMIRRVLDWGGYVGIAVLAFGAILPFVRPEWNRFRWIFLAVGILVVLLSLLARVEDYRGLFGRRAMKYGANTAVAGAPIPGAALVVPAPSFPPNPPSR